MSRISLVFLTGGIGHFQVGDIKCQHGIRPFINRSKKHLLTGIMQSEYSKLELG